MKKGFRFKVLFLFLPKMNLTQEILWSYSHLGALKSYQFKEMDNKTFGSCIGIIIGIVVIIAIAAFFMSIFIYLLWPIVIPAVFPKLVAEGYIVGKLSPAFSLGVAILCASLFKGTSYKN